MKLIVGILVVVIGLFVVVIWLATCAGNTLAKQAQKLEETAARGTDWLDVVAYKKPKQYFKTDSEHNMGRRRRTWNEQEIADAIGKNQLPEGFMFEYILGSDLEYLVYFDSKGKVTSIKKKPSMSDLAEGKLFTH